MLLTMRIASIDLILRSDAKRRVSKDEVAHTGYPFMFFCRNAIERPQASLALSA